MMRLPRPAVTIAILALLALRPLASGLGQSAPQNVIIITIDGLRWQEFFGGAQRDYFKRDKNGSGGEPEVRFWRESVDARRQALMPFMWSEIVTRGQIFGDPDADSLAHVTNGLWFSYPGYNEMFAGVADARIDSNDKKPNPNVTVLEWLNRRPGFERSVAAFGSWDVLPFILNKDRSGLVIGSGWNPVPTGPGNVSTISTLAADLPRYWDYGPFDAPMAYAAQYWAQFMHPRVLYLMLGEGDEWAHEGRYDLYLDATRRADSFIERIWDTARLASGGTSNTTLIVTTDHGRGATTKDWTDHGKNVPAAERTWIAVLGPGVPALGVRRGITVTTSQIAATIAAVVGEDFRAAVPAAAPALPVK
jgi:hypothetical protein